jgi:hypothetical protein
MENKSIDLLSKLMATENITVLRQKVRTASFDLKSRTLRLPTLIGMTAVEETVMEFHEVGHALFTGEEYFDLIKKQEKPHFGSYMNILEDVRIERMMKEYYPGCRKDFFAGYKSLNARDFFGVTNRDINSMCLIDRINVHFKVGFSSGVKFNKEERQFIVEADKTETIEEVYELAERIYAYSASEKNKKQEETENDIFGESEEDDEFDFEYSPEDGDEEYNEDEDDLESFEGGTDEESLEDTPGESEDDAPAPETQEKFNNSMLDITNIDGFEYAYIEPKNYIEPNLIGYKEIVNDFKTANYYAEKNEQRLREYNEFRSGNNKVVAHLVKEFEMRKAAQRYSRTQTATTGSLSMKKIHQFKTSDDLFRKMDIITDDKNHSFLMLLDWSGSMDSSLQDSLGQVITLASFCRRVNIPFQVCAFSDNRLSARYSETPEIDKINEPGNFGLIDGDLINILTFFDSKMTNSEFDFMCEMLYTRRFTMLCDEGQRAVSLNYKYRLGGTPLVESLAWLYGYIDTFKKMNKAEKMTVITVTDGEGSGVSVKLPAGMNYYNVAKRLRCPKTGRVYSLENRVKFQTSMMAMIKHANPEVRFIGFFVASELRAIRTFNYQNGMAISDCGDVTRSMNKHYFYEYPSPNYDKLYVIPRQTGAVQFNSNMIDKEMTAAKIARAMTSSMTSVLRGRVVLTKFISEIA